MDVIGYTADGDIIIVENGTTFTVADDLSNHYRRKIAQWEVAGNTIPPYMPPAPGSSDVNAERQRRIVDGKSFNGIRVTGRDEDVRNLTNLALAAQIRIGGGDTTTLTTYRDGDNVDHDLTPPEILSLWEQASAYVSALYATSWAMKDGTGDFTGGIPDDYTADIHWS